MHIQPLFSIAQEQDCLDLMRSYPLATLVTFSDQGCDGHLLPLEVVGQDGAPRLRGHIARGHAMRAGTADGSDVLLIFQGPSAYISPRWYVNGQRSGRVAPSWNYVAVQAKGRLRYIDDPAWMQSHLASLTASQESRQQMPWSLAEAAPEFVQQMARQLLGFEIDLHAIEGKRFLSQQRTPADRASLIAHLRQRGGAAADVAELIEP